MPEGAERASLSANPLKPRRFFPLNRFPSECLLMPPDSPYLSINDAVAARILFRGRPLHIWQR